MARSFWWKFKRHCERRSKLAGAYCPGFWAAGFQIIEGYGLTETSPVIAVGNFLPHGVKIGTVGPALPGVQIKIASDGEILAKGPNVMLGYFKRPDLTAEIIDAEGGYIPAILGILKISFYELPTVKKKYSRPREENMLHLNR